MKTAFAIRRVSEAIPTLLVLIVMTFFLLRLAPGGPFDSDQAWPPEIQANILRKYHLDEPLTSQFLRWFADLLHGDLNESFQYLGRPVTQIIGETLPTSLGLGGSALLAAILCGIPLGSLAAARRGKWVDRLILFFSISGVSVPVFLVASLLILFFSLWLDWLPPALWESPASAVLPILTLAYRPAATITRLTRSSVLETLQSDYIRTARGKGLSEARILFKHALKNSVIPVLTAIGPLTAHLITGSFLVELVFQIPGMGKHFVQAVLNRDYPLVMGVTLIYGMILISCNLIVDLVYDWIDPRIELGASK